MGRPCEFSQEIADQICSQVAEGKSIVNACDSDENLPAFKTAYNWFQSHPEFLQQYARAKEIMLERMASEINSIADNTLEDANSRRVRVDTRKWLLSKLIPKVYGDATLLKHADAEGNKLPTFEVSTVTSKKKP